MNSEPLLVAVAAAADARSSAAEFDIDSDCAEPVEPEQDPERAGSIPAAHAPVEDQTSSCLLRVDDAVDASSRYAGASFRTIRVRESAMAYRTGCKTASFRKKQLHNKEILG